VAFQKSCHKGARVLRKLRITGRAARGLYAAQAQLATIGKPWFEMNIHGDDTNSLPRGWLARVALGFRGRANEDRQERDRQLFIYASCDKHGA
jgi:hypothetical protein